MVAQNALALIPARGGSRGIARKNIVDLGGKPLIAWTIAAARECPSIARVVVSSDDDEILEISEALGAEPLKRPAEFAADDARPEAVLIHGLNATGTASGLVAYLQPTSPLRTASHLTEAFVLLEQMDGDALISVSGGDRKILKSLVLDSRGYLLPIREMAYLSMNRQDLPPVYMQNGAIYIMRVDDCQREPRFFGTRTIPYIMDKMSSLDIDKPEELEEVRRVFARVMQP